MTNRSSSNKKHGMIKANAWRPKSSLAKRRNKQKAMAKKAQKNAAWQEMIKGS